ncbi:MAG: Phospho-N-acetylmuramoyl-pentapeptide-transferase [Candidatus Heimdallarchaeota archaeon LC_3]|nr:MAG: Phospho-N-acetylmuramoyl-pentapeptide-transferase [Candidatus Heimdallarchaeota archaeon LC_3]
MIYSLILALAGLILSIVISVIVFPFVIRSSLASGMTTVDAHKKGKPIIAEPGGLATILAFTFSFLAIIVVIVIIRNLIDEEFIQLTEFDIEFGNINEDLPKYLGGILAVVIAGLIGLIDDIFGRSVRWREKIFLGFLPSFPLIILGINNPIRGIEIGILYAVFIIPLGMNFAFNSYNMLAGYNGLETGLGIISFTTILIVSIWVNDPTVLIFAACMLGALLVLFWYNKYPAKVLIGNSGTLMLGAALFVVIILGNLESLALGIFLLYFINFVMFFFYLRDPRAFKSEGEKIKLADIDDEENLIPPSPWAVYWIIPFYRKNTKEYTNVMFLLILQTIICGITIFGFFLMNP